MKNRLIRFLNGCEAYADRVEQRCAGHFGLTIIMGALIVAMADWARPFDWMLRMTLGVCIILDMRRHKAEWTKASAAIDAYQVAEINEQLSESLPQLTDDDGFDHSEFDDTANDDDDPHESWAA